MKIFQNKKKMEDSLHASSSFFNNLPEVVQYLSFRAEKLINNSGDPFNYSQLAENEKKILIMTRLTSRFENDSDLKTIHDQINSIVDEQRHENTKLKFMIQTQTSQIYNVQSVPEMALGDITVMRQKAQKIIDRSTNTEAEIKSLEIENQTIKQKLLFIKNAPKITNNIDFDFDLNSPKSNMKDNQIKINKLQNGIERLQRDITGLEMQIESFDKRINGMIIAGKSKSGNRLSLAERALLNANISPRSSNNNKFPKRSSSIEKEKNFPNNYKINNQMKYQLNKKVNGANDDNFVENENEKSDDDLSKTFDPKLVHHNKNKIQNQNENDENDFNNKNTTLSKIPKNSFYRDSEINDTENDFNNSNENNRNQKSKLRSSLNKDSEDENINRKDGKIDDLDLNQPMHHIMFVDDDESSQPSSQQSNRNNKMEVSMPLSNHNPNDISPRHHRKHRSHRNHKHDHNESNRNVEENQNQLTNSKNSSNSNYGSSESDTDNEIEFNAYICTSGKNKGNKNDQDNENGNSKDKNFENENERNCDENNSSKKGNKVPKDNQNETSISQRSLPRKTTFPTVTKYRKPRTIMKSIPEKQQTAVLTTKEAAEEVVQMIQQFQAILHKGSEVDQSVEQK
ncbi:hypothetical protein TRFO_37804 [Tritrichomonas foetus]|uniref:Uncharacterized protein n=1 Tax=Tritrichomonas foetus TaxID=1144522 RepID=A0A1J4JEJ3_9EUKA|nr:hypothetical protein TRFO_37804 [Tritrichomonas foetus]|eukprot:OHS96075.1 hypothetical protein TRFO_37804 [Tritrichomonas foetus]